jgi:transcription antitermination factor NusG
MSGAGGGDAAAPSPAAEPAAVPGAAGWYALRTRARHEKRVQEQLAAKGIEPFLPLVERWSQWQDRRKLVAFPLFPGYCFARFSPAERVAVLSVPGVVQILGSRGVPVPVPEAEIAAVRRLVTSTLPYDPHPYLQEGMRVEVTRGPLVGLQGILLRKGARARLVIGVSLIRQGASVELDAYDVRSIS